MKEHIVSLDLETTGLEVGVHKPISIGAVNLSTRQYFYCQLEWDNITISPEAMRINKIDIINPPGINSCTQIYNRSLPANRVLHLFIDTFTDWIRRHNNSKIIALGVNVGSFDLKMLKSIWPDGKSWPFHYRSIDLNSLMFVIAETHDRDFDEVKKQVTETAWDKFKENKPYLAKEIGEHHALADAWWNIYALQECTKILKLNKIAVKFMGKAKPIPFDFEE